MNEAEITTGSVVCVEAVDDCELAFNDKYERVLFENYITVSTRI